MNTTTYLFSSKRSESNNAIKVFQDNKSMPVLADIMASPDISFAGLDRMIYNNDYAQDSNNQYIKTNFRFKQ